MKNSVLKNVLGTLAVAGVAVVANKALKRKKAVKGILNEFGIKEKTPFAVADKIREMNDKDYKEFKSKMKKEFSSKCGCIGDKC